MSSTIDEEERKNNITFSTRIADIYERYHRSPTSYELRALKELPLEVSLAKNLWDSTHIGRKIHQLLLDSKNGKDVTYLEEAGRLLWFQEGMSPFDSSTIPDFITPFEKLEKQSMLPEHTHQTSAITNDPFAKAVKRRAVESVRMENQASTSEGSTKNTSTTEELHLSAVNQTSQIASHNRTPTLSTQSSTFNLIGNSFHNHSNSISNYQSQVAYLNNQTFYDPPVRDFPPLYLCQTPEVRQTGSEHHTDEQDYGPELEISRQTSLYQVRQYNISNYDLGEDRYDAFEPGPSMFMRLQPVAQYKSPYKNMIQIPKTSEHHSNMGEDSINRQEPTEVFNEQWDNAFGYNQQPQQYAVQNMYPDPGKFLYFGDGFYPKDIGGPLTYDPKAYPPQITAYGTGRSKYGPPKYQGSISQRSAMSYSNTYPQQTASHGTVLDKCHPLNSQDRLSQISQYDRIQQVQKSNHLPPPPATPDPFQTTAINNVSELHSMTAEASVDDPRQSVQSFNQRQIQGSYPSYPFDNARLDTSQLGPGQQARKKNVPTTKTPRKRTPKAKDDYPTARRFLTYEDYHKTTPPSQEDLIEPIAAQPNPSPSLLNKPPTATESENNPPSLKDSLSPNITEKEKRHRNINSINIPPMPTSTSPLPLTKKIKLAYSGDWFTVSADYRKPHVPYPILGIAQVSEKDLESKEKAGASAVGVQPPETPTQLAAHNLPSDEEVTKSTKDTNPINAEEEPPEKRHTATAREANSPTSTSLPVNPNKPLRSIQEDGISPLKPARTAKKKSKVNKIEGEDGGEYVAKEEMKNKARRKSKRNAV